MKRFTLPRDLYYGDHALDILKELEGKKAFVVVGGSSMKRAGFLDETVNNLKEAGMEVKLFENVESDPSVETVRAGAKAMTEFEPDWIVSIGGGSPIDAAKAMWVLYEHPEKSFEDLIVPFSFPKLRRKAKFCAISSTSGTATEVTAFSVITDYEKGIKYPLADFEITPDIAILDPRIVASMPKRLTADTGMDALTHGTEAYVSLAATDFTDPLAMKAISMIFEYLEKSYNEDMEAREKMHYAQCMAGQAFSNALLGIVHSLAHKTGAVFSTGHIVHGYANAMYLPYVIEYNMKDERALRRYADIGRMLGFEGDDKEVTLKYIDAIRKLNKEFDIVNSLKEFGIKEDEFKEKLEAIAHNAVLDACTGSNPREIDDANMEKLLDCIYYGKEVDF
ncbi:MAG: iron-containing alcohol dehydrogenase [Ezakiella sp.]|nr:iron-containing alcohol dehydrogenase [Ezakiella sp.]MDD7472018.1 iron-containing alcohol dehydrogenase [Bacillota bacterium]MDY3923982.1 iron-containing alcohol dehydrogenase [Ezakiella sp.]